MDRRHAETILRSKWPTQTIASTAVLRDAGITDRHLTQGVKVGVVVRLRHGVYVPAHHWFALKPWEQDEARVEAHLEGTRGRGVYCLTSAAILHGLSVWDAGPFVHTATEYGGSRASRSAEMLTHELRLAASEIVTIERRGRAVRVTSLLRTVTDCLRFLDYERALVIGDSALHRGLVTREALQAAVEVGSQRGRRRALGVLADLEPNTESPGESRTRALLRRLGYECPVAQFRIMTAEGLYRADFAWVELKIIIEFDGEGKYRDYQPTADVLLAERRRETLLMEEGWIFIRLRWSDLDHPEEVQRRIASAMLRAARRSA